ncbi:DNA repair protein RecN, partial [filamentous cyanobacterium CCP5]
MLEALHIENFALIDRLDLQLQPGLNVLTGETGAGKSILLDAIDAVLGGKASQRLVRTGTRKAVVVAHFTLTPFLKTWLESQNIEAKGPVLVCSREITAGKSNLRSRFRLNEASVNKPQMEALRPLLVEITAQGQTMLVGSSDRQREWLDGYGGERLLRQRQQVAEQYEAATQARQTLERRRKFEAERLQQLDLFEYQARELNAANLDDPQELDQLIQEAQRLSHSVELQQQSYQVYQ